jgi:PKHD-type hydroxylase
VLPKLFQEAAIFIEIENILTAPELARLDRIAASAKFIDGRASNPHNQTKYNLQIDTASEAHRESSQIVGQAFLRNEQVRNFAFIHRFAPPMLCRYQPDMKYGKHPDAAFLPMQPTPLRSDISSTIFIADPASYDGGELTIHLGSKPITIKGKRGSAVLYPSTTIHEVQPVTRGERLVAITFIESQICDEKNRDLLYTLNEVAALEGLNMDWENRVRLEHVRHSLHRMWST